MRKRRRTTRFCPFETPWFSPALSSRMSPGPNSWRFSSVAMRHDSADSMADIGGLPGSADRREQFPGNGPGLRARRRRQPGRRRRRRRRRGHDLHRFGEGCERQLAIEDEQLAGAYGDVTVRPRLESRELERDGISVGRQDRRKVHDHRHRWSRSWVWRGSVTRW